MSIKLAAPAYARGNFGSYNAVSKAIRYVGAILRNRDNESAATPLCDSDIVDGDIPFDQEKPVN